MRTACIAVAGTALLVAALAGADDTSDLRAIGEGRALYLTNCAGCHGPDASGLTGRDLTGIAQRDKSFDRLHVANHIQGRRDGFAPGTAMPAWRVGFTRTWPGGQVAVGLNTLKLVRYLEFVQAAPPPTVAHAEPRQGR
jgi:mono/diheme cytochrome c family protein